MYIKNKKGQSTVEYVLLVTAVIAVIIAVVTGSQKNGFQWQLNTTLNDAVGQIDTETTAFQQSHELTANPDVPVKAPYTVNPCTGGTPCK